MRRVALITGGTRGIGLGIARALAREGCDLALCGIRPEAAVRDVCHDLTAAGCRVVYCRADVSDPQARKDLLHRIGESFGALHVLINNAGIAPRQRLDILEASEASFEEVLRVNLQGPYFLTQGAARWMIEQRRTQPEFSGCIVNVSSISATEASPERGEYCISKAGVAMATQLWAVRLAEFDIPVYEVRPGVIETDMTAGVKEKYDRQIADDLLLQPRWGLPEDVGKAVAALVRGDFSYSTGATIMVDGGLTVRRL